MEELDDNAIAALKARSDKLEKQLVKALIEGAAAEQLRIAGVTKPKLILPHVLDRLRVDLSLEDDPRIVTLDAYGHESPMSVGDLVNELRQTDDFGPLFEVATPKQKSAAADDDAPPVPNPFRKGSKAYNVTQQVRLLKSDPKLAERLRAEADAEIVAGSHRR